jgi:hypothetical protein
MNLSGLFKGCTNLVSTGMTEWPKVGGSKASMFEGCASLPESEIHDFVALYSNDDSFDTTNISQIFVGCNQVTSIDWSNVTLTESIHANYMYGLMENLETLTMKNWRIEDRAYEDWSTGEITYYPKDLFGDYYEWYNGDIHESLIGDGCKKLKTVDMSGWQGKAYMRFFYLESLESVNLSCDEQNEGKKLYIMSSREMFFGCQQLKEVNLKNVDLNSKLDGMFAWCQNLTHINFDGCNMGVYEYDDVEYSVKNMFYNCIMLQRENISMVGCSDKFIAAVEEAFANRYTNDESYRYD